MLMRLSARVMLLIIALPGSGALVEAQVTTTPHAEASADWSTGIFLIKKPDSKPPLTIAFAARSRKVLFEVEGRGVLDYSEGLAAVVKGAADPRSRIYGFIDATGRTVVQPQFEYAQDFSEGLARVKLNGRFGYIDKNGKWVIPAQFSAAWDFREGLALVKKDDKWVYVDPAGKVVIETRLDDGAPGYSFYDDRALTIAGGKRGYIDKTGKMAIEARFDGASEFSEGLAAVAVGAKWGFIDRQGEMVIQPQFKQVHSFTEGLAAVSIGGESPTEMLARFRPGSRPAQGSPAKETVYGGWGFIDRQGRIVVESKWAEVTGFSEGLAAVVVPGLREVGRVGSAVTVAPYKRMGYVDRQGKVVIEPQLDRAGPFKHGLAEVRIKGKLEGLIDKTGRVVFNAYEYTSATKPANE